MTLPERLKTDLLTALKAKAEPDRTVLRSLLTALKNAEIAAGAPLDEAAAAGVLQKQLKQRQESVAAYAERPELAQNEEAEATVIRRYLPDPLSEEELQKLVDTAIQSTGATGASQMGTVMGALKPLIAGRADGAAVASLVKARLA